MIPAATVKKFSQYIRPGRNGCVIWAGPLTAPKIKGGRAYGSIWCGKKKELAHRVAFAMAHGRFPTNVRRTCRNHLCVNPQHLVDMADADRNKPTRKEPGFVGMANARKMRRLYQTGRFSMDELGTLFGVGNCSVVAILYNWSYFDPDYVYVRKINEPFTADELKQIKSWRRDGMTQCEIANRLNRCQSQISQLLSEA